MNANICQIRLDLEHFSLSGPEPLNHVSFFFNLKNFKGKLNKVNIVKQPKYHKSFY